MIFPSPVGMSLTKLSLAGNNLINDLFYSVSGQAILYALCSFLSTDHHAPSRLSPLVKNQGSELLPLASLYGGTTELERRLM